MSSFIARDSESVEISSKTEKTITYVRRATPRVVALKAAQPEINPAHIDVYVTPYHDSKGPAVKVGRFSAGLASAKEDGLLATIAEPCEIKRWQTEDDQCDEKCGDHIPRKFIQCKQLRLDTGVGSNNWVAPCLLVSRTSPPSRARCADV
jgi:hypothetical protein